MGQIHTQITLRNGGDVVSAQRGYIKKKEIREITVTALVDTGAGTIVIGEDLREKLGLSVRGLRGITLAGGVKQIAKMTEPVDIHWRDRETSCRALVLPGGNDVLLGAIPLEDMDLIICPKEEQLVGAHGDEVVTMVM
jgi:clan AA aspartic protease